MLKCLVWVLSLQVRSRMVDLGVDPLAGPGVLVLSLDLGLQAGFGGLDPGAESTSRIRDAGAACTGKEGVLGAQSGSREGGAGV